MNLPVEFPRTPECFGEIIAECRDALAALSGESPDDALGLIEIVVSLDTHLWDANTLG